MPHHVLSKIEGTRWESSSYGATPPASFKYKLVKVVNFCGHAKYYYPPTFNHSTYAMPGVETKLPSSLIGKVPTYSVNVKIRFTCKYRDILSAVEADEQSWYSERSKHSRITLAVELHDYCCCLYVPTINNTDIKTVDPISGSNNMT